NALSTLYTPALHSAPMNHVLIVDDEADIRESLEAILHEEDYVITTAGTPAPRPGAPEVIMISGHAPIEAAVRATKLGAYDFLEKPLSMDRTLLVLRNAMTAHQLREDNQEFVRQLASKGPVT